MKVFTSILMLILFSFFSKAEDRYEVKSPDGLLIFNIRQESRNSQKAFYYSVNYKGKEVIKESLLDLQFDNYLSERAMALKADTQKRWFGNLKITGVRTIAKDTTWKPVVGENAAIRDRYNALSISTVKEDNAMYLMNIEVRVYNEGVGFRFFFPENEKGTYYRVVSENTEFTLPDGTKAWHAEWAQAPYQLLPLKNWRHESERPLTLELPNNLFVCLAEAKMVDYSRTKFKLSEAKPNTIVTSIHDPADLISPFATPWRVIMVAEKASRLIENNEILLNLNDPSRISDESWIKPGKIIRVMKQTTRDALQNIDFAAERKLQYVLFDWKWYGPAFSFSSDATKVAIPDFDLPKIISYAKDKGIGVWLYVNQQALLAQSDSLFSIYKDWGIKGVKFGFVVNGSHRWTNWLQGAFKKAADNQMMVNVHDDWRPTGEQRTWPNLMTSEGIRGNEEMPDATSNTVLPFTRMIAGAGDYTICYYDSRIKTSHAHQLALAVVYYSPLQTLYWYDTPDKYQGEPEIEFFDKVPTTWDETKVLGGRPGEYVSTARRNGEDWFLGTITNNEKRTVKVSLDFLPKGKKYTATIYADDPSVQTRTKVGVTEMSVTNKTVLDVKLAASGGHAMWIRLKE
ncbi:glycoside hydrolase family 97 protein [Desertivirga xinjiangensis]|uniref:glycoside hydrolase family 97 protein n=1 Tax=Desertivirga xinjiangensis TaxID=539206 RepID=UPI00210A572C|nr:glycoside hydrolase family 97 protein [Pedobacter xinjiangensis]